METDAAELWAPGTGGLTSAEIEEDAHLHRQAAQDRHSKGYAPFQLEGAFNDSSEKMAQYAHCVAGANGISWNGLMEVDCVQQIRLDKDVASNDQDWARPGDAWGVMIMLAPSAAGGECYFDINKMKGKQAASRVAGGSRRAKVRGPGSEVMPNYRTLHLYPMHQVVIIPFGTARTINVKTTRCIITLKYDQERFDHRTGYVEEVRVDAILTNKFYVGPQVCSAPCVRSFVRACAVLNERGVTNVKALSDMLQTGNV